MKYILRCDSWSFHMFRPTRTLRTWQNCCALSYKQYFHNMFEWGKTHQRLSSLGIKSANPSEQYVESGKSHRFSSSWVGNQPGCHPLFIRDGYPFQRKSTVFARCSHIFKIRDGHVQKRKKHISYDIYISISI